DFRGRAGEPRPGGGPAARASGPARYETAGAARAVPARARGRDDDAVLRLFRRFPARDAARDAPARRVAAVRPTTVRGPRAAPRASARRPPPPPPTPLPPPPPPVQGMPTFLPAFSPPPQTLQPSPTPEPATLLTGLVGAGLAGLAAWRKRRRKGAELS